MKGEYFKNPVIVSEEEAWYLVFESDVFRDALEDVELKLEHEWRKFGISEYRGFHLRKDGLVEVQK